MYLKLRNHQLGLGFISRRIRVSTPRRCGSCCRLDWSGATWGHCRCCVSKVGVLGWKVDFCFWVGGVVFWRPIGIFVFFFRHVEWIYILEYHELSLWHGHNLQKTSRFVDSAWFDHQLFTDFGCSWCIPSILKIPGLDHQSIPFFMMPPYMFIEVSYIFIWCHIPTPSIPFLRLLVWWPQPPRPLGCFAVASEVPQKTGRFWGCKHMFKTSLFAPENE